MWPFKSKFRYVVVVHKQQGFYLGEDQGLHSDLEQAMRFTSTSAERMAIHLAHNGISSVIIEIR